MSHLRIVMRAVLWVQSRYIEDLTMIHMRLVEAHDLLMELVDLFVSSGTEGEVVQTWVGLVMRGSLVAV